MAITPNELENDLLAKALAFKEKPLKKAKEENDIDSNITTKSLEKSTIYSYPEEFNIIPATIYFNNKQKKIIKQPKIDWTKYQTEKYPREKLKNQKHLCVVCGKISNNLLVIDFDIPKGKYATEQETNDIYNRIIKRHPKLKKCNYVVKTMRGGLHFYFFLESINVYKNLREQEINIKAQKTGLKTDIEGIKEIDLRCEGNIVLTYPSEYKGKKYELWLKKENPKPLKITNKEFLEILKSITITTTPKIKKETKLSISDINTLIPTKVDKKFKKLRTPFKDILYGKFDVEDYAEKHKKKELIYWKFLFRELYHKCGIEPEEVYDLLKENQPAFKLETTKTQLKHHPYTEKPLTNEKLKEYFPDYNIKESKKLTTKEINEKYGKPLKKIPFDNFFIEIRENGVYRGVWKEIKKEWYYIRDKIMHGNLDILYKTIDNKGRNLFTFNFNNNQYNTHSIEDILRRFTDKIYKGNTGRDIIKHCFNIIGDQLENGKFKAEYITGFNDGWKLPQTEIEKHFLLVCYTDYQTKTYSHAKNMIKEYSIE